MCLAGHHATSVGMHFSGVATGGVLGVLSPDKVLKFHLKKPSQGASQSMCPPPQLHMKLIQQ